MIKSFYIDNFKSLVDFRLPPAPHRMGSFTCLVGLNGAGKSTVLQAFDFVGHLANGQMEKWHKQHEWKAADLTRRLLKRDEFNRHAQFQRLQTGAPYRGPRRSMASAAVTNTQTAPRL